MWESYKNSCCLKILKYNVGVDVLSCNFQGFLFLNQLKAFLKVMKFDKLDRDYDPVD